MTTIVNADQFNVTNESFQALKLTRISVPGMGSVNKLGNYVPAYVEIGVIVALIVVILLFVLLRWSKLGRNFYAVGGNQQSANMLASTSSAPSSWRTFFVQRAGGHRRLCVLPARGLRLSVPCQRL